MRGGREQSVAIEKGLSRESSPRHFHFVRKPFTVNTVAPSFIFFFSLYLGDGAQQLKKCLQKYLVVLVFYTSAASVKGVSEFLR